MPYVVLWSSDIQNSSLSEKECYYVDEMKKPIRPNAFSRCTRAVTIIYFQITFLKNKNTASYTETVYDFAVWSQDKH